MNYEKALAISPFGIAHTYAQGVRVYVVRVHLTNGHDVYAQYRQDVPLIGKPGPITFAVIMRYDFDMLRYLEKCDFKPKEEGVWFPTKPATIDTDTIETIQSEIREKAAGWWEY